MSRRDRHHLHAFWRLIVLVALWIRTAHAGPPTTVVLVRTGPGDPRRWKAAEERTRDELRMLGLQVAEVELREEPSTLARALAEHGAVAAVHVVREGALGVATVWSTRDGDTPTATRLGELSADGRSAAALAALRVTELVRLEVMSVSEPPRPVAPPHRDDLHVSWDSTHPATAAAISPVSGDIIRPATPAAISPVSGASIRPATPAAISPGAQDNSRTGAVPPRSEQPATPGRGDRSGADARALDVGPGARDRPPDPLELVELESGPTTPPPGRPPAARRAVGLYAGGGGGFAGAGGLVGGGLALRRHVARRLALQGELRAATSPTWLSGHGRQFRIGLAGARAALVFVARRDARVAWRAALGGGFTLVWALGRTPDRTQTSRALAAVGVVEAHIHAAIRARDGLRVVLGVDLDLLLPPVAVRVLGEDVARLGAPVLRGVLGIEWDVWTRVRSRSEGPRHRTRIP